MDLYTRSNITYVNPEFVAADVYEVTTSQCFAVATAALLAYDILTTMDKEVKYFWGYPVSYVNVVYFANRYLGLLGSATVLCCKEGNYRTLDSTMLTLVFKGIHSKRPPSCKFSAWTRYLINCFTLITFDYVLMIRVLALYSQNQKLGKGLKILLALETLLTFSITIYATHMQHVTVFGLEGDTIVCAQYTILPLSWGIADWSISAVYGIVLMVLALYKANQYWRMSAGVKGIELVSILIRDQAIYFLLIILCCVFNVLKFKVEVSNVVLAGLLGSLGNPQFLSIAGSRMLINLREAGERGANGGTTYYLGSVSTMAFAND